MKYHACSRVHTYTHTNKITHTHTHTQIVQNTTLLKHAARAEDIRSVFTMHRCCMYDYKTLCICTLMYLSTENTHGELPSHTATNSVWIYVLQRQIVSVKTQKRWPNKTIAIAHASNVTFAHTGWSVLQFPACCLICWRVSPRSFQTAQHLLPANGNKTILSTTCKMAFVNQLNIMNQSCMLMCLYLSHWNFVSAFGMYKNSTGDLAANLFLSLSFFLFFFILVIYCCSILSANTRDVSAPMLLMIIIIIIQEIYKAPTLWLNALNNTD